jgi:hypothetical protein
LENVQEKWFHVRQNDQGKDSPRPQTAAATSFLKLMWEGFRMALRLLFNPKTMRWIPCVLNEGMAPVRRLLRLKFIEAHNTREIKNLLAEGVPITFVTSFPRSGNTWTRYLLSDVFLQNQGIDTTTKLDIHPDEIIADFYRSLVAARNKTVRTPGVLLKTHDSFAELGKRFCGKRYRTEPAFRRCRHLYLFRSPEDALVSLYHHHLREKLVMEKCLMAGDQFEINAFCREALPGWIQHLSGYLDAAENGAPVYFASYDQLLADPKRILGEILQWLGAPHTGLMLERAACNMEFQKLKATDARDMGDNGCSGAGAVELKASTIEFIRANTAHLIERANRRAGRSPAAFGVARTPGEASLEAELRYGHPNLETMASKPRAT